MMRIGNVPRDKRRNVLMDRVRGINRELSRVSRLLRFDYGTLAIANDELASLGIVGRFQKPFFPASADAKPRVVSGEIYDSSPRSNGIGDNAVALMRGMTFQGAEFIGREVAIT
jgi:hypothetical protein